MHRIEQGKTKPVTCCIAAGSQIYNTARESVHSLSQITAAIIYTSTEYGKALTNLQWCLDG